MDKESIVQKFQMARLCQWIGATDEAENIYSELEEMEGGLSYVLKPVVRERKKEIPKKTEIMREPVTNSVKENHLKQQLYLFDVAKLKLENKHNIIPKYTSTKWKYSISVMSKLDEDLRFELRGFNPSGEIPLFNIGEFSEFNVEQWNTDDSDLIWYSGILSGSADLLYISVDRWGLLSGTAIIKESQLAISLALIHTTICELDNFIWKK
ncbi:hypothetical protein [Paenibacillus odorifer]|uniref:hypothetical protein n=1 Tax=Paenibacillus TaxID=44249 RepID=UPI00096E671D|nr:hypothetical protein [Paenibacillus odorifer]OME30921.1 hypothetical protein BSK63_16760 [Paenibacillus odorifer]OME31227.1 hypothetical protein BSK46_25875 [Paenibacillus odorifer]